MNSPVNMITRRNYHANKLKITEGIFPMPVLMVATYNEDGSVNVTAAENVMVDGKIDMSKVNTIALS